MPTDVPVKTETASLGKAIPGVLVLSALAFFIFFAADFGWHAGGALAHLLGWI